jgi:hypothetical protein
MIVYYTFENKPEFKRGDEIEVNMNNMEKPPKLYHGNIVCKIASHIIDTWAIESGALVSYVPHTHIVEYKT